LDPHASDFGVDEADVYQLLAYAARYGCTSLELAYPQPVGTDDFTQPPVFKLQAAGPLGTVAITIKLVPLWSAAASGSAREAAHFTDAKAA
jgi:5-methylcytosine-specific restriction enzyme subunit McrC